MYVPDTGGFMAKPREIKPRHARLSRAFLLGQVRWKPLWLPAGDAPSAGTRPAPPASGAPAPTAGVGGSEVENK